ncbi:MAG TPA: hypothetical protein DCX45_03595 [Acinetobacter junii]|nr:hypothetical protein [Acinetobacter junii]
MRDLKTSEKNELLIFDNASGSRILIYYSTPTTKDRLQFNSLVLQALTETRDAEKAQEVQISLALEKITGFGENCFVYDGKQISSNKEDENYYAGWRSLLKETAADILITFARTIFAEPNFVLKNDKGDLKSFFTKSSNSSKIGGPRKNKKNTNP